jgi:hypothetical protein
VHLHDAATDQSPAHEPVGASGHRALRRNACAGRTIRASVDRWVDGSHPPPQQVHETVERITGARRHQCTSIRWEAQHDQIRPVRRGEPDDLFGGLAEDDFGLDAGRVGTRRLTRSAICARARCSIL